LRHFLAPVTIDLKNARRRLRAQEEEEEEEEEESLSREFFLFGRREREREEYIHTHTTTRAFLVSKVFPFSRSLKGHAHFYSHLSLKSRRRRRSSFRENRLLSVANTDTQRESE